MQQQQPQQQPQQLQQQYVGYMPTQAAPPMMVKQEPGQLQQQQQLQYQYQPVPGYGAAPGGMPAALPMHQQQPGGGVAPLVPGQPGYDPMTLLNGVTGVAGVGIGGVPGAVAGDPAGMSTAESSVRGMSFMTNGAPVLVRGGGGLGAGNVQLTGLPGIVGAPNSMPIIKIEGVGGLHTAPINNSAPGGGMIPINMNNGGIGLQDPMQLTSLQPLQQQNQLMQPDMMMPINTTGGGLGPSTTGMIPAPGLDHNQQQQQNVRVSRSLDDILGEIPSDLGADLGTDGGVISPTAKNESRKQQILKQQRWLLFLRHCARCSLNDTECPYGGNCGVAKQLWQHLVQCKSETCPYPRCSPSRALLRHHQRCKSPQCPVCAPVKQYVAKQREAILRKKLDASGFSVEQQARYVEQVRARRANIAAASAAANSGAGPSSSSAYVGGTGPIVDPQAVKRPRIMLHENMKTSLIEFFNALDIRKHIQLVHLDGQNDTSAARRPTMMSTYDDFRAGFQEEESCCKVCHRNKMTFEPPTLYCDACGQRIKRNQTFYATPKHSEIRGLYCHPCMTGTPGDFMQLQSFSMRKADMEKKRNDDEQEEAWVQCDNCEGWVHQICGLFNKGRNNEERGYLCPPCLLNGLESGHRSVPAERPQAMLTAKDLPRCNLSDFLENRLQQTILSERIARAKATGRPVEEIKSAEGLCVRVVNNVTKKMEVKANFCSAFATVGSAYPDAASYKQKVVLLFQHQDGVDMCLFCLYLQEYGDDCSPPNNRVVHVSYLDSVKYFLPEKMSAAGMGVALRTMVYHDILLGYCQYAKSLGYCAMHIWACPPMAGDDYILYCHPGKQKMPRSDRLREWYLTMLRRGKVEGTVTYISNLYDTYFEGGKDHRIERPSILELPYLDGDYWPGEAENLLADLNNGNGGFDPSKAVKGRKPGKEKRWKPSHPDATLAEQVLGRLGETIQGMREDFIVAHLYENCSHCRKYIDDDLRYYHPNPPQKVTIKSERTFDGIALDKPGADSSRTIALTRFQLCSECYTRESGQDPAGFKPLGLPSGIALQDLVAEPCPKIPPTIETVPQIDNEFFDTRNQFLSLCQGNHYQFDTARRARHSSMMVLYHLHNPSEPAFTSNCSVCQTELKPGEGYRCLTCTDFDMCAICHASPAVTHPHQLVPQATRKFDETRMRLSDEDRVKRDESLQRTMALLVHASDCRNQQCRSSNCAKVKALFNHAVNCTVKITGGCTYCRRMWALLQAHSKMCIAAECPVPRCRELRALRRQQATRQEDQRRAAYRQMLMQQQGVVD
jgi:E1A/CREB-binding protein